jgi:hypothetical protein
MRIRGPSPAMVVALVALVLSAGGGVAAGALITSVDIADDTVRSADIRDETINGGDVHNGALSGSDVARDSLTGADVREASLGQVRDADRLDGLDSTKFVRKAEQLTRHFSCDGAAWENGMSWRDYTVDRSGKHGTGAFPPTLFLCNVSIPDGARVTAVSFSLLDAHSSQDDQCSMWRTDLTGVLGNTGPPMAYDVMTSGAPGKVRLSDRTIENPVIDNSRYSYFVTCFVGNDDATGLYAATVTYRVTAG